MTVTPSPRGGFLTDQSVGSFLAQRRKLVAGVLAIAGMLVSGGLVPGQTGLIIQGIVGLLGAYGIHEVANDPLPQRTESPIG